MTLNISVCLGEENEIISINSFSIEAEAAVLIDAQSGKVLYSKNMDKRLEPASITKILTAYIGAERLSLDDVVVASDTAIDEVPRYASHIAIDYDEELVIKDLLYAVMLPSANDAANVIAEAVSNDLDSFAVLMNQYVSSLGLENTNFVNANGLPDDNHYTSAYDMAMITRMAIQNEIFTQIYSTRSYTTGVTNKKDEPRVMANGNKMIQNGQYNYEYAIGGKTGYTDDAGFTCVTVAKKDGLTLIGVLLNNSDDTDRYDDMPKLFDYGFSNYSTLTYDMLDVEETILDFDDQIQTFKLNDNIHILVPVSQKNSILSHSLEMADVDDSEISKVIMNLFLDDVKITSLDLDKTIEYKEEVGIDTLSIGYDSDNIFLRIINWTSMLFLIGILFNIAKNKFIKENSK
jgi:D-alanyl-D-alanine carboxypeptidase